MDYLTDFPSKRLNIDYKTDPASFALRRNTYVDTDGKLLQK